MSGDSKGKPPLELMKVLDSEESEFIESTIKRLAKENAFGQGKLVGIAGNKSSSEEGRHFMSKVEFKIVSIADDDGNVKETPLVIKIQVNSLIERDSAIRDRSCRMFSNEVTMFNDVLPLLRAEDIALFPRHFFSEVGETHRMDIVVVEDLTKRNFHLLENIVTVKERMSFLVRKLGEFHGLCYRVKKRNPSVIEHLKKVLKSTKHFCPEGEELPPMHKDIPIVIADLLKNESADMQGLLDHLRSEKDMIAELRAPEEPFATVVHADLFNSNIFVTEDSNGLTGARFIDLQTSFYSDPAFDFAFLIFMCASVDLMLRHWDDFVDDYWNGITSVEPDPGFNRAEMEKNINRKALSGFMDACFFIIITMTPLDKLHMGPPPESGGHFDREGAAQKMLSSAPQEAKDKLISIMKFAIKKGFVRNALKTVSE